MLGSRLKLCLTILLSFEEGFDHLLSQFGITATNRIKISSACLCRQLACCLNNRLFGLAHSSSVARYGVNTVGAWYSLGQKRKGVTLVHSGHPLSRAVSRG